MNSVFCIFLNESDGYTYSCETLLRIFETQEAADEALLLHLQDMVALEEFSNQNQKSCQEVWEKIRELQTLTIKKPPPKDKKALKSWKNMMEEPSIKPYYDKLKELSEELLNQVGGKFRMSADIADYEIREIQLG